MIEWVRVQGFEAHEDLTVELSPTVTTFVGHSDSGKSSILRALRWLAANEPAGGAFVRHGCEFAQVTVKANGKKVGRKRGKGVNSYTLGKQTFPSPGHGVPKPVRDALPVTEDNFQGQIDPPFWLWLKDGDLAKEFNKFVSLDEIDNALGNAGLFERRAKSAVAVSEERLKSARNKREELKWAVELDKDLTALEGLNAAAEELRLKHARIDRAVREAESASEAASNALAKAEEAATVASAAKAASELAERVGALDEILGEYNRLKEIQARHESEELPDIEILYGQWVVQSERLRALDSILNGVENLEFLKAAAEAEAKSIKKSLKERAGGSCPTCGRPI